MINLYLVATDNLLISLKETTEKQYKDTVVYGSSNPSKFGEDVRSNIANLHYAAIVVIDSQIYSSAHITAVFQNIKDITSYVDEDIKVYYVTNGAGRVAIPRTELRDSKANYFEIDLVIEKDGVNFFQECILQTLFREHRDINLLELQTTNRKLTKTNKTQNTVKVYDIMPMGADEPDTRHVQLLESVVQLVNLNNNNFNKNSIIDELSKNNMCNALSLVESSDDITAKISTELKSLEAELVMLKSKIETGSQDASHGKEIIDQYRRTEACYKTIALIKDKRINSLYTNIMDKAIENITNRYLTELQALEQDYREVHDVIGLDKSKEKVTSLKQKKLKLSTQLTEYEKSIASLMTNIHNNSVQLGNKLKDNILNIKQNINDKDSESFIVSYQLALADDFTQEHAIEKELMIHSKERLASLVSRYTIINKLQKRINEILEIIVAEQDNMIDIYETQKVIRPISVASKLEAALIGFIGMPGVGKTVTALNTLISYQMQSNKRVALLDLDMKSPKLSKYTNDIHTIDLLKFVDMKDNEISAIQDKLCVITTPSILKLNMSMPLEWTYETLMSILIKNLKILARTYTTIGIILPSEDCIFRDEIINLCGRVTLISDLIEKNYLETGVLSNMISNLSNAPVKYFIVNKYITSTERPLVLEQCNVSDTEYIVLTVPKNELIANQHLTGAVTVSRSESLRIFYNVWSEQI